MFRPSGKSIYSKSHLEAPPTRLISRCVYLRTYINVLFTTVQRKEYSETLNRESDTHFRVEVNQCEPTLTVQGFLAPLTPSLCAPPPPTAPPHLRAGRSGVQDSGKLCVQAEEAGWQRSGVAPADDHGGAPRVSGAQRHRDQGQTPHTSDKSPRVDTDAAVKGSATPRPASLDALNVHM